MSLPSFLQPKEHNTPTEALFGIYAGLNGTMVGIIIESIIDGGATARPLLESPIHMSTGIAGVFMYACRKDIYSALKNIGNKSQPNTASTIGDVALMISPKTNLQNQRALGMITNGELDEGMCCLKKQAVA